MCGIVGIFQYGNRNAPIDPKILIAMRDSLSHRGPDDAGIWIDDEHGIGLAHRRLSIIDLSSAGRQPLSDAKKQMYVTFNGEIYNYREIREALLKDGLEFLTQSDTEVIPNIYLKKGLDGIADLNGMFAFALWDSLKQQLVLVRDRLGIKPVYYTKQNGKFIFASEIKALLQHPEIVPKPDLTSMMHYLTFKTTPHPHTMFANIKKLEPGNYLICDKNGNLTVKPYWNATSPNRSLNDDITESEAVAEVTSLLTQSVKDRLVADVPVGAFLSGGLDSSAIVSLMSRQLSHPVKTYAIGIKDVEGQNELEHAAFVANYCGTDHQEIMVGWEDVKNYMPQLVYGQDEPLADPVSVPIYYLSKYVKNDNVPVVMVGEGSDELFFGYDSRLDFFESFRKNWQPLLNFPVPILRSLQHLAYSGQFLSSSFTRYGEIFERAANRDALFWGSTAFKESERNDILLDSLKQNSNISQRLLNNTVMPLKHLLPNADIGTQVTYTDLKIRLAELLLMRTDKITMSVGLEARVPFMDYKLVEFMLSLPLSVKLSKGNPKHLLKKAMSGIVPDQIINRKKMAFAAPVSQWLNQGMMPYAKQLIFESKIWELNLFNEKAIRELVQSHENRTCDNGVKIWTFMNLAMWYDHWM